MHDQSERGRERSIRRKWRAL